MTSIFTKIIKGEVPSEIVFENENLIAIKDIFPKAEVHILIITKKEIPNLQSMADEDFELVGEIVAVAQQLAKEHGIDRSGYRLLVNNGPDSGQEIDHLHFHLLGGNRLGSLG